MRSKSLWATLIIENNMRNLIYYILCFTLISLPINANEQDLKTVHEKLESEKNTHKTLKTKLKKANKDLKATKNTLTHIAKEIHETESELQKLQTRINNLTEQKNLREASLKKDRAALSNLILALQRIKRTPPQAILARPDAPYKTAQSAMLMTDIIPAINTHAEKLKANLETLENLKKELERDEKKLQEKTDKLKDKETELITLLDKRQNLYVKTNKNLKKQEQTVKEISLQAADIEDLVARLKIQEKNNSLKQKSSKKLGDIRLPITGTIKTSYNERDDLGSKSKGLTILGRPAGLVVSPAKGKVQFTGAFKRYGNIVVIEHENGYHSLVAGLGKITCSKGSKVKSGEPIGTLPNSSLNPRPKLYYELRRNGNPVNPSSKIKS